MSIVTEGCQGVAASWLHSKGAPKPSLLFGALKRPKEETP